MTVAFPARYTGCKSSPPLYAGKIFFAQKKRDFFKTEMFPFILDMETATFRKIKNSVIQPFHLHIRVPFFPTNSYLTLYGTAHKRSNISVPE